MKKVFIVEDDQTIRELLKTLLELEGYSVFLIGNASENDIINSIREINPEFLLLDVHLRQANGVDILTNLRRDESYNKLFIIMASGMDYREQCMRIGSNGYLLKPYMPDELLGLLNSISNKIL
jgi:DNA-binding response OmpR family regulator